MNKTLVLGAIVMITLGTTAAIALSQQQQQEVQAITTMGEPGRKAPITISGDNTYIAWWTNITGNDEVIFRASTDGGATFTDKINLSNTTGAESQDVEIAAEGANVIVTWWERNQTANEPVVRVSTDNGATFGDVLRLAANGTLGEAAAEEEPEEGEG